ncbi:MAG: hypothetical protein IKB82_08235 [Clostridia bacterium]|nr:hypothetical protein [Clostridia bacterium]MBR6653253.1 hypothetical protein [Oscillospiraceae bacterium]
MTKKEMTELFSVMLLAWPNAEMFKGGIQKLGPTIELWTACTTDVDFWTAQRAVLKLCKECKFPPTIAEFREKVESVESDIRTEISHAWQIIRMEAQLGRTNEEIYDALQPGGLARMAIDAIGGPSAMTRQLGSGESMWNYYEWENAYKQLIRRQPAIEGSRNAAIGGPKQIGGMQK